MANERDFGPKVGARYVSRQTSWRRPWRPGEDRAARKADVTRRELAGATCAHPLADLGYSFDVPLLEATM